MFIIPIQELDEIVNYHFVNGDVQTQSTNDEEELQEQPWAGDVDEEEREDPPDWGKNERRPLFLTHCRHVDKSFIVWQPKGYIVKNMATKRLKCIL